MKVRIVVPDRSPVHTIVELDGTDITASLQRVEFSVGIQTPPTVILTLVPSEMEIEGIADVIGARGVIVKEKEAT